MKLNKYKVIFIDDKSKNKYELVYESIGKADVTKRFNNVFGLWSSIVEIIKI